MNVTVIGAGHVGLVLAACLADFGLTVACVDKVNLTIERLERIDLPFFEPGLCELVDKNVLAGRLCFSTDVESAIKQATVIFVVVGTEPGPDGRINLDGVHAVAEQIAGAMEDYKVVVIKSTVPIGTAVTVGRLIQSKQKKPVPFDVVSNPEFLREGSAIETFMRPERIILGARSERAFAIMREIYRPLYLIETPIITTTNETAELIKYAANAFLAVRISLINEVASLCDSVGCDVHVVAKAVGLDRRIGPKFLHPGPGFGGSCLPKDIRALLEEGSKRGIRMNLVEAAIRTNEEQPGKVVAKLRRTLGKLEGRVIAILGLAYKTNTDDVRESPSLRVCHLLLQEGSRLRVHDPMANGNSQKVLSGARVVYCENPYEAARGADALVILTEWNEFRNLDMATIRSALAGTLLVDARNIYDPQRASRFGFAYEGIGRQVNPVQESSGES